MAAALTSVVLALTLVLGNVWLLAAQTVVFLVGTAAGVTASPYGWGYRVLVRPRLSPPVELEDPRPPRFAQAVGLAVAVAGLVTAAFGVPLAVEVAAGVALTASLLNAVFGLCLGCELYLRLGRVARPGTSQ